MSDLNIGEKIGQIRKKQDLSIKFFTIKYYFAIKGIALFIF